MLVNSISSRRTHAVRKDTTVLESRENFGYKIFKPRSRGKRTLIEFYMEG
jgi:hypothetical protein